MNNIEKIINTEIEKLKKELAETGFILENSVINENTIMKEFENELVKTGIVLKYEKYDKRDGKSKPDFMCIIKEGGKERKIFVEVTKLLSADREIQTKNEANKRLALEINKELKKKIGGYKILITLDPWSSLKGKRKEFIDEIVKCILENLNEIYINTLYIIKRFNRHKLLKKNVKSILTEKSDSNGLTVEIVSWYVDPQFLSDRILEIIKNKETKNYKESPVWLVIHVYDGISNPDDIKAALNSLNINNSKFERIYIQSDYWPETSNYPLFLLFLNK